MRFAPCLAILRTELTPAHIDLDRSNERQVICALKFEISVFLSFSILIERNSPFLFPVEFVENWCNISVGNKLFQTSALELKIL